MNKAEVVSKYAKAIKGARAKSAILAICGGIITGLMYHVGVSAGVNATYQNLAEALPEDAYNNETKADENN